MPRHFLGSIRRRAKDVRQKRKQIEQAGRAKPLTCELCDRTARLCYDHDHKTGRFRGWLCGRCNLGLGSFEDNPELLRRAINYIVLNNIGAKLHQPYRGRIYRPEQSK